MSSHRSLAPSSGIPRRRFLKTTLSAAAAAALIAAPVGAATRPAAAVPTMTTTATMAAMQDDDGYGMDAGTIVVGILAAGLIVWGIITLLDDGDDETLPISLA